MSDCPFYNLESAPQPRGGKRSRRLAQRARRAVQWLFPATLAVLMPKCPMCIAAYFAALTGIGMSVSTAQYIQILLLASCLTSLAYLAVRQIRPIFQRSNDVHRTSHAC